MSWFSSSHVRRTLLVLVPALIAGLPLLSWAQGSTPPAQGTTITLPSSAASKDSAMKTAAAAGAHKAPTLSDSTRAALKSQIELELKAEDPLNYESLHTRLRSVVVSARETCHFTLGSL